MAAAQLMLAVDRPSCGGQRRAQTRARKKRSTCTRSSRTTARALGVSSSRRAATRAERVRERRHGSPAPPSPHVAQKLRTNTRRPILERILPELEAQIGAIERERSSRPRASVRTPRSTVVVSVAARRRIARTSDGGGEWVGSLEDRKLDIRRRVVTSTRMSRQDSSEALLARPSWPRRGVRRDHPSTATRKTDRGGSTSSTSRWRSQTSIVKTFMKVTQGHGALARRRP